MLLISSTFLQRSLAASCSRVILLTPKIHQSILLHTSSIRFYSTDSIASDLNNGLEKTLILKAPNRRIVKMLKLFSISSTTMGIIATPFVTNYWSYDSLQSVAVDPRLFIGALFASVASTAFLHFLVSPYVTHLYLHGPITAMITPSTKITLCTLDILARSRSTTLRLVDLRPAKNVFVTWRLRNATRSEVKSQSKFWLDIGRIEKEGPVLRRIIEVVSEDARRARSFHMLL